VRGLKRAEFGAKQYLFMFLRRWWRLAFPTYFVLLFIAFIFPKIAAGPLYNSFTKRIIVD